MRRSVEAACWAVGLFLLNLVFISSVDALELLLGVLAALAGGVLAVAAREASGNAFGVRPGWWRWLARVPLDVARDLGLVAVLLARRLAGRRVAGRFVTVQLPDEREPYATTARAVAGLAISLAPGSYLVNSEPARNRLLLHTLHSRPTGVAAGLGE